MLVHHSWRRKVETHVVMMSSDLAYCPTSAFPHQQPHQRSVYSASAFPLLKHYTARVNFRDPQWRNGY